ncbi:TAXI family TRAP transporter solute-binding subunit [Aquibium sp. A9E412]|uniref:TAXI family TRAP transporter solute-binding subunit n=1 Tax=Aquibium sp. A9E412 TaxID=2976767 RepID=UPI0025B11F53|nr:TAXI family TRAP transporter solute-binding subunit [Aquibium sp. A9E412]MDN2568076.1 TAXI family TRAP transporter solute-binding subunit [Aquibium sp. A9E412]
MTIDTILRPAGTALAAAALGLMGLAGQAAAQTEEIGMRCAPFGSIMYTVGNAIQDLTEKRHPTLRIVNAEGPGSTAVTVNMMAGGEWAQTVGCTSVLDYVYAEQGVEPFFDEPHPDVRDQVKVLFNGFYGAIGILTTDPAIESATDLDGRTLALGRRAQAHWGGLPALFLESGLPDVKPEMEFMGTTPSHEALPEGRADAIISQLVMTPDGTQAFKPGVVSQLFASGQEIHLVGFPEEAFERAAEVGLTFRAMTVDKTIVPEAASDRSVKWIYSPASIAVHKDFPEETAYELTKFMIENAEALPTYAATLSVIATTEGLLGDWKAEDLHPGAARAFREAGALE